MSFSTNLKNVKILKFWANIQPYGNLYACMYDAVILLAIGHNLIMHSEVLYFMLVYVRVCVVCRISEFMLVNLDDWFL